MNLLSNLQYKKFSEIDLNDPFFDSLKADYEEFSHWFQRKSEEKAYVLIDEAGFIQAFLYLKEENEAIIDVEPNLPHDKYLKMGTFKINAHGTKLGERFLKKAFDHAIANNINKLYVTVFSEHQGLIDLLQRFGFQLVATKVSANGTENVLLKEIGILTGETNKDYPLISLSTNQYLLSIYPEFHTRLFPDSILNNEKANIIDDVSFTNSIEKIYICKMRDVEKLKRGDILVIYRTKDDQGSAWYRSVATSICVVEEVKTKTSFRSLADFLDYSLSRSVFSREELTEYYKTWYKIVVIKMTYNAALHRRIIMKRLVEEVGLSRTDYWGFRRLTPEQVKHIARLGEVNASLIID
ncbi:MAG TPA: GNAT family N-acetyltransferase [Chloroflexota bacterium]|nr:GNAT family N-acetyltransferase [Chloroflexota bacterium]HUM67955.1 GNAT family N-acetyltransferase [Chloroflexota bacterium]